MSGRLKQLRERLLHLSESLAPPGAYYGEDDPFTFCDAQDREALGVAIGLLDAEIAEREAPPPVSLEALRAWVRTKANAEPGERFKGLPERWLDNPTWRCLNGHVSKRVLKTEEHGDLCLACRERLVFTFPEDKDGQIEAPPPVLEEGLAKIAKQLESVGAFFHTVIYKPGGEPVEATVTVNTAADALRALALRGARPATRAEWLAVALDLAQDEGEATEGLARTVAAMLPKLLAHESLRQVVASALPRLKLCTPWLDEPGVYERSVRDCATGAQLIAISDELEDEGDGRDHTYTLWIRGRTQFGLSASRAELLAAEWLVAGGWVQVAEQPESAEPDTDERSYAPEETGGIHPDPRAPVWRRE